MNEETDGAIKIEALFRSFPSVKSKTGLVYGRNLARTHYCTQTHSYTYIYIYMHMYIRTPWSMHLIKELQWRTHGNTFHRSITLDFTLYKSTTLSFKNERHLEIRFLNFIFLVCWINSNNWDKSIKRFSLNHIVASQRNM